MPSTPADRRQLNPIDGEAPASVAVLAGRPGPEPSETALPSAVYFRAALIGVALAVLATALAVLLALLIVTGPFHTALGDIG